MANIVACLRLRRLMLALLYSQLCSRKFILWSEEQIQQLYAFLLFSCKNDSRPPSMERKDFSLTIHFPYNLIENWDFSSISYWANLSNPSKLGLLFLLPSWSGYWNKDSSFPLLPCVLCRKSSLTLCRRKMSRTSFVGATKRISLDGEMWRKEFRCQ